MRRERTGSGLNAAHQGKVVPMLVGQNNIQIPLKRKSYTYRVKRRLPLLSGLPVRLVFSGRRKIKIDPLMKFIYGYPYIYN
jgi:hypothetical protein